jgi:hypothetical protein
VLVIRRAVLVGRHDEVLAGVVRDRQTLVEQQIRARF